MMIMNQVIRLIDIGEGKTGASRVISKYRIILNLFRMIRLSGMLIFSILLFAARSSSYSQGTVMNSKTNESTNLDSVNLVYNSVDASNFPRIVSLVSVMNRAGLVIGKLDENNFAVHEDSVRQLPIEVVELPSANVGINVVLTIDRSESMKNKPIEDAKAAAIEFVEHMQSNDQSAIVSFAEFSRTDHSFSSNKDSLKAAISAITVDEWTSVFDAVIHSVNLMSDNLKNRAIILLTDGEDNHSRHSYPQALIACLSKEICVFTIGLGINRNSPEEDVLIDLANQTNGRYYYSPTSDDLEEIYRAISRLLHHRYQISYTTHNPAKDGTLRHVGIEVFVDKNTSADTASYRAPYEPDLVDPIDPIDPIDPDPVEPEDPVFEAVPNPFTPNHDGFNDWTEFRNGDGIPQDWNIAILDHAGRLIRQLTNGETIWNGTDKTGAFMLPGYYLYIVSDRKKVVHRGIVQLIR